MCHILCWRGERGGWGRLRSSCLCVPFCACCSSSMFSQVPPSQPTPSTAKRVNLYIHGTRGQSTFKKRKKLDKKKNKKIGFLMDRSLLSKLFTCSFFIEILWETLRAWSNRFVSKEKGKLRIIFVEINLLIRFLSNFLCLDLSLLEKSLTFSFLLLLFCGVVSKPGRKLGDCPSLCGGEQGSLWLFGADKIGATLLCGDGEFFCILFFPLVS